MQSTRNATKRAQELANTKLNYYLLVLEALISNSQPKSENGKINRFGEDYNKKAYRILIDNYFSLLPTHCCGLFFSSDINHSFIRVGALEW